MAYRGSTADVAGHQRDNLLSDLIIFQLRRVGTREAGTAFAEKALQQKIEIMLELLGLMLKTYCEKGRMISTLELQKAVSAERVLSLAEKIRMGMNRLMMLHFRDQDRARFMRQFRSG